MKAQADYYRLPSAANVLEQRIAALSQAIPPGSRLLDIGCNDGSISRALLSAGVASKVYGYDLENLIVDPVENLLFEPMNLLEYDLPQLPDADGVLLLNVLHHIVGASEQRAVEVINYLLDRYPFVCVDMGSITEVGDWVWRNAYDNLVTSDKQLWDRLFAEAGWRFKLLRYPAQGGHRVLWKLRKRPYALESLTTLKRFTRNHASWPGDKQLIEIENNSADVDQPSVEYEILESPQRDRFFVKRYTSQSDIRMARLEAHLGAIAASVLRSINDRGVQECRDLRLSIPISSLGPNALISLYEPDLVEARPVHYQDWSVILSPEDARASFVLACGWTEFRHLPPAHLLHLSDFQVVRLWDGLAALDFEPNAWVVSAIDSEGNKQ